MSARVGLWAFVCAVSLTCGCSTRAEGESTGDGGGTRPGVDSDLPGGRGTDGGMAVRPIPKQTLRLTGMVRDFQDSHPDFEKPAFDGAGNLDDRGIVTDSLGSDDLPVYANPSGGTLTTTGPSEFDQWYRDVSDVNQSMPLTIELQESSPGIFTYDDQAFFPVDGQLFGNQGRPHNYHFTFELHTTFVYSGGERFTFNGDDDLWVFIHGQRVIDLGGIHAAEPGTADLDALAPDLGLELGQTYALDLFFAERHVVDSHFRIDTSLTFILE